LEGYINSLTKEGNTPKDELMKLVEEGLALCRNFSDTTFHHLFTMHYHSILAEEDKYYHYLENEAYPHFDKMGYVMTKEFYAVKLFDYYMSKNDMTNANRYAGSLVDKFRRDNQFV
jgi:hypothetical protein